MGGELGAVWSAGSSTVNLGAKCSSTSAPGVKGTSWGGAECPVSETILFGNYHLDKAWSIGR
jgi:hypothetical protein